MVSPSWGQKEKYVPFVSTWGFLQSQAVFPWLRQCLSSQEQPTAFPQPLTHLLGSLCLSRSSLEPFWEDPDQLPSAWSSDPWKTCTFAAPSEKGNSGNSQNSLSWIPSNLVWREMPRTPIILQKKKFLKASRDGWCPDADRTRVTISLICPHR